MSNTTLPRLLTARQVAEDTGLPLARVYELAREGAMPCVRLGRAMRFDAEELRSWLANGGTASNENGSGR